MVHFYYHEEDREPAEEAVDQPSEQESEKKPVLTSLYYFDQVIDE